METDRIDEGQGFKWTTTEDSRRLYDASPLDGDASIRDPSAVSVFFKDQTSALKYIPANDRQNSWRKRRQPGPNRNTTALNSSFRSHTNESIDVSTCCSTVVDEVSQNNRRVRQGSDLSVLSSRCSEVGASSSPENPNGDIDADNNSTSSHHSNEDEKSLGDFPTSPRFQKLRESNAHKLTAKFHDDSGLTSHTCLTYLEEFEPSDRLNDPSDHTFGDKKEDADVDELIFQKRTEPPNESSSSSSGHDIAFDDSDSSSQAESIQILNSTRHLIGSKNEEKKREPVASPALRTSIVNNINTVRLICGKIINQEYVQHFIIFLILVNALLLGIGTFDFVEKDPQIQAAFDKADMALLCIFTIESGLQLIFHGIHLFRDAWLTFDVVIVVSSWLFASMQVFRTLRTVRLIARVKLLRRLCEAMVEAVPRLSAILFLFILVMYIYAVMITVLYGDLYERGLTEKDYFSRLDTTAFTLFQMITLEWAAIVREVMVVYPFSWAVFTTYLTCTSFILFSLIIGVVCDAVGAVEHDARLVDKLEKNENAQTRILRLQHQVNYLKKQQTSVLASVQTVLDGIVEREHFASQNPASLRSRRGRELSASNGHYVAEFPTTQSSYSGTPKMDTIRDST